MKWVKIIAICIAGMVMPLSVGYLVGGKYASGSIDGATFMGAIFVMAIVNVIMIRGLISLSRR